MTTIIISTIVVFIIWFLIWNHKDYKKRQYWDKYVEDEARQSANEFLEQWNIRDANRRQDWEMQKRIKKERQNHENKKN